MVATVTEPEDPSLFQSFKSGRLYPIVDTQIWIANRPMNSGNSYVD